MVSPLIVDYPAASLAASAQDIRAWASGRRIFVSSLITDMPTERDAARSAIESLGAIPVMFEDLGGQDIAADEAYLAGVRSSAIYVGMWGFRYGVRMADGYSATHAEFLEAEKQGLRLCIFVRGGDPGDMDGAQKDLVSSARNLYTTGTWTDSSELAARIRQRLEVIAAEELAPWIRLGNTILRAREIVDDGSTITVSATVRSKTVHTELVRLRDARAGDLNFASPNTARKVQISSLSTRTSSTTNHEETLVLSARDNFHSNMRMSYNGLSADEVGRRALSDGLFGTTFLGDASMLTRPADPLEPLHGLGLDDSILRPVSSLLLTEHLLSTKAASTVDNFALGPARQGKRRLRVAWSPPSVYVNEPAPLQVSLDGMLIGL